jgi:hypothetical protein
LKDVLKVLINRADVFVEKLGHLLLGEPDRFVQDPNLNPRRTVCGLIDQEL